MSVYRSVVGRHGISIPARNSAKFKTLVQDIAIGMCLAPPLAGHWTLPRRRHLGGRRPHGVHRGAVLRRRPPGRGRAGRRRGGRRRTGRPERPCASRSWRSGTELLLGQIADTNSQWLGEHLAALGVASHFHQAVGDNHDRIVLAFRTALARSDGVIVCGGLGPTHDDITREAIAEVMNVPLAPGRGGGRAHPGHVRRPGPRDARLQPPPGRRARGGDRHRPDARGPRPGLICPVGHKVVYAVPGVPYEMSEMFEPGDRPRPRPPDGRAAASRRASSPAGSSGPGG